MLKSFPKRQSTGSKPQTGNISDNQLTVLLDIPQSTLRDWKKADNYKNHLYWFLKSIHKEEILNFIEISQSFKQNK